MALPLLAAGGKDQVPAAAVDLALMCTKQGADAGDRWRGRAAASRWWPSTGSEVDLNKDTPFTRAAHILKVLVGGIHSRAATRPAWLRLWQRRRRLGLAKRDRGGNSAWALCSIESGRTRKQAGREGGREGHRPRPPGSLPPRTRRAFDIREASSALHLVRSPRLGLPGCSIQYGMPPPTPPRPACCIISYPP